MRNLKHRRGDVDEPHRHAFIWNMLVAIWTANNVEELNTYKKIISFNKKTTYHTISSFFVKIMYLITHARILVASVVR